MSPRLILRFLLALSLVILAARLSAALLPAGVTVDTLTDTSKWATTATRGTVAISTVGVLNNDPLDPANTRMATLTGWPTPYGRVYPGMFAYRAGNGLRISKVKLSVCSYDPAETTPRGIGIADSAGNRISSVAYTGNFTKGTTPYIESVASYSGITPVYTQTGQPSPVQGNWTWHTMEVDLPESAVSLVDGHTERFNAISIGFWDWNGWAPYVGTVQLTVVPATPVPASITVIAPNGYQAWNPTGLPAMPPVIKWVSNGVDNVKIDLYKGGIFLKTIAASVPAAFGVYSDYTIDNTHTLGGDFQVRVSSVENPSTFDASDNDFVIRCNSSILAPTATSQSNPPSITVHWPSYSDATNTSYEVFRRTMNSSPGAWGSAVATGLGVTSTSWTDTTAVPGTIYEYKVLRNGYGGFVSAGIDVPLAENRGTVILLVDDTMKSPLAAELLQMKRDLVGDGWKVIQHDVARKSVTDSGWKEAVVANKDLIKADAVADPNVKAVYIIGHVAIPYSGDINPDGHDEHKGAWPADGYYGDLGNSWTDTVINNSYASLGADFAAQRNIPGDGKFDQSTTPSFRTLAVGRVDLRGMSSFALSETELLRQYLNKDHNFRYGVTPTQARVVVDENFTEGYANTAYLLASLLGGDAAVDRADFFTTLRSDGAFNPGKSAYLFAYGNGGGGITSAAGVGTTADFAYCNPRAIFTSLFGSYFGDWDHANGFLRAPLATGYGLTCVWGARPNWTFHAMGMGQTTGYSTMISQNEGQKLIHVALMGDPTLRLHVVPPVTNLAGATSGGVTSLYWTASADPAVVGYHVYRATDELGPFTRLTGTPANATNPAGAPITATSFTDSTRVAGTTYKYMVRAVKNERGFTPGGANYFNLSQGVFADEGANTSVWDGGADNDTWSSAANWTADAVPSAGQPLVFGGTTRLAPSNDLSAGTAFSKITFNPTAGSFNLTGNSVTLTSGVANLSAASQTISLGLALGGDCLFNAGVGDIIVNGPLSSSGGLLKTGIGTLTLAGTNSHTGRVAIDAGTLRLGSAITTAGPLQLSGPGVLDLNGNNATFTTSAALGGNTASAGTTITDNAAVSGTTVLTLNNNNNQADAISALITDGVTRKVGVSVSNNSYWTQTLRNASNTFSGGILVSGGVGNGSRLYLTAYTGTTVNGTLTASQLGTGAVTVGTSAAVKGQLMIDLANAIFRNEIIFNTRLGADTEGGVRFGKNNVTLAGKLTANLADASFFNNAANGSTFSVTGQITGTSGFQLTAAGFDQIVILANSGVNANDYNGNTSILRATSVLQLGANNQLPDGAGNGNVNVVGTLRLNGFSDTINGLTGNGTVHNNHATTAATLTLGAGNATATFSGVIANGAAAALHLVKTGTGTQTLSGTNTYSGNTTIMQGMLVLARATLADAANVSISGTLRLDHAATDTIGGFVLNGTPMWKGAWGPVGSSARYQTPSITGTGTLLVTSGPDPGFNGWAWESDLAPLPPAQSGPQGNPDGDSNNNLLEWALGLDPLLPDRPSMSIERQPGQLEFIYQRSTGATAAGVGYTVEWSESLAAANWRTDSVTTEILSDNGQTQTVKATITTGGGNAVFSRLRVTAP